MSQAEYERYLEEESAQERYEDAKEEHERQEAEREKEEEAKAKAKAEAEAEKIVAK